MARLATASNPFLMMMNPEVVLQAVERSERLKGLQRRVCRPLDKPLIPKIANADQAAYDDAIDVDVEIDADTDAEDAS